jgi:hypothetical protein
MQLYFVSVSCDDRAGRGKFRVSVLRWKFQSFCSSFCLCFFPSSFQYFCAVPSTVEWKFHLCSSHCFSCSILDVSEVEIQMFFESSPLGCDVIWYCDNIATSRKNTLPPWRWRQRGSLKRWYPSRTLDSFTAQKTSTYNIVILLTIITIVGATCVGVSWRKLHPLHPKLRTEKYLNVNV